MPYSAPQERHPERINKSIGTIGNALFERAQKLVELTDAVDFDPRFGDKEGMHTGIDPATGNEFTLVVGTDYGRNRHIKTTITDGHTQQSLSWFRHGMYGISRVTKTVTNIDTDTSQITEVDYTYREPREQIVELNGDIQTDKHYLSDSAARNKAAEILSWMSSQITSLENPNIDK